MTVVRLPLAAAILRPDGNGSERENGNDGSDSNHGQRSSLSGTFDAEGRHAGCIFGAVDALPKKTQPAGARRVSYSLVARPNRRAYSAHECPRPTTRTMKTCGRFWPATSRRSPASSAAGSGRL